VTTKKVGMVDKAGFRAPWHLFTVPGDQLYLGYLIEHGHRLFGFVVGACCIVLAAGMTLQARGWYRARGWLALAAVGLQGVLGIFRVNLNVVFGPSLALVHGCVAQLVFAVLVAVAVVSSRAWWGSSAAADRRTRNLALGLCVLVYVQVVFGAVVRHRLDPVAQRLHVLLAFAVVAGALWLGGRLREAGAARWAGRLLVALIVVQPVLGVEAWVRRFGAGVLPELVPSTWGLDLVRSGHHLLGTLIFSTTAALAVLLCRPAAPSVAQPSHRELVLEGAA
jgi:heme A synthase